MDAYIIYNDPNIKNIVINGINNNSVYLNFIDEYTKEGKKKAYLIKSQFGARKTPFIGIFKSGDIFKGFYSEASEDPINDFIKYINND